MQCRWPPKLQNVGKSRHFGSNTVPFFLVSVANFSAHYARHQVDSGISTLRRVTGLRRPMNRQLIALDSAPSLRFTDYS